jgi:ParB-like chromosome segregation protein Spo0J
MKDKYGFSERKKWPWLGEIEIDDIVIPDIRVTAVMPSDLAEQFKGSIAAQGVLNPVRCIWDGQNIILVDGLHRLMEARNNKQKTVPAVVVPGSLRQAMLENLTTGKLQGRGKVTDMIRTVKYLVDTEKMTLDEIALKTGYKMRYLSDLLAIANAHPDILRALDEEQISLGAAIEIARIPDTDAQLKVLWNAIMYRMKLEDVKDLVDKTIEVLNMKKSGKYPTQRTTPRDYVLLECHFCGAKVPAKDMRTIFLCPHCLNMLWEMKIEAMKQLKAEEKASERPVEAEVEALNTDVDEGVEGAVEPAPEDAEGYVDSGPSEQTEEKSQESESQP